MFYSQDPEEYTNCAQCMLLQVIAYTIFMYVIFLKGAQWFQYFDFSMYQIISPSYPPKGKS